MTKRFPRIRVVIAAALATATAGLPLALGANAAAASGSSSNTPTPVAAGMTAAQLPGATVFGNTPPNTPETVSFVLRAQNYAGLASAAQAPQSNFLTVAQFARQFGQTPRTISQLQSYLAKYGITTQVYADDLDVVASGTAGEFDAALAVQQRQYHVPALHGPPGLTGIPAQNVHGISSSPMLPQQIAQNVLAILGLTNYGAFTSNTAHIDNAVAEPQSNASYCEGLTGLPNACNLPSNFASNYGLSSLYARGAKGQGQTLAIVTLAALDPGAPQYFWQNVADVDQTGNLTVDNIDGGPGAPSNASGTGETDLDVEQSGALAPDANVLVYQAPNTDFGFADAFFAAASDDLAGSVSSSWGLSETLLEYAVAQGQEAPGYAAAFDEAFMEMALQGQSGFVASGDSGAYEATDLGTTNLSTGSPDDSPWITSAGETTLPWSGSLSNGAATVNVSVPAERTWGWDYLWGALSTLNGISLAQAAESAVVGSGGGFSGIESTPSYQLGFPGTNSFSDVEYLSPTDYQTVAPGLIEPTQWSFNPTPAVAHGVGHGRAEPDLSTDADPYSGYLLYSPSFCPAGSPSSCATLQGGWGGTSFVAPQLNGATAVIDSALGHRVGFWNPEIYRFARGSNSPFSPLDASGTASDNIFYTGTPGTLFNEGSGLGTPNLGALAQAFASQH